MSAGALPLYGHVDDVDPRHRFEQLAGEMAGGAVTLRGEIELARMRFGKRDQLLHGGRLLLRRHRQHQRHGGDERDRHETVRIVGELLVKRLVDGERRRIGEQQRIAVRRGLGRLFGADIAAGAGPVVDDHRLAPFLRQLLRHHAHQRVGRGARRRRHDDLDRPRRIGLRLAQGRKAKPDRRRQHKSHDRCHRRRSSRSDFMRARLSSAEQLSMLVARGGMKVTA